SITHRRGNCSVTAATSSGKYRVIGRSLRLPSSTSPPSAKTMERNPSHFGSKLYGPSGILLTGFASIRATGGVSRRGRPPFFHPHPPRVVGCARYPPPHPHRT